MRDRGPDRHSVIQGIVSARRGWADIAAHLRFAGTLLGLPTVSSGRLLLISRIGETIWKLT
jgi:hypothetical protein